MPWFLRLVLLLALTSPGLSRPGSYSADAQTAASTAAVSSPRPAHSPPLGPLDAAFTLYRRGDFDGAIHDYHQILQQNPASPEAYAGLTRVYLKKRDIAQASATVHQALQAADGPEVHVALGEVYFRQGKISDAELEWAKVINAGHSDARAYLGLARVRWAISNYKSAWAMIEKAHDLNPTDPEILRLWMEKLSPQERVKVLEDYLAGANQDEETRTAPRQYLEYLKAQANDPRGSCRLVSKAATTVTSLVPLLEGPQNVRGYGLTVTVNRRKGRLLLDTGATGILINRNLADKAGLIRLSDTNLAGVGDKGTKSGYRALVHSLKLGGLEFHDCVVEVFDKHSLIGEEGLLGADVFSDFLVDLDFPSEKLRLTQLPNRPDEVPMTIHLQIEDEDESWRDSPDSGTAAGPQNSGARFHPQDSYIPSEMKSYTRILRFGHLLLVPTAVGDVPGKLFLLDTGAQRNHITPAAAREITKVHGDSGTIVHGLSGSVKNVYRADQAILQFGHLRQENQDLVSFDLTHLSDDVGTEISGTLGFAVLRMLDLKIDYRDGLIDFAYDPKRWNR